MEEYATKKEVDELRRELSRLKRMIYQSSKIDPDIGFDPSKGGSFGYGRPGSGGLIFELLDLSDAEKEVYYKLVELWKQDKTQNNGNGIRVEQVSQLLKKSSHLVSSYLNKMCMQDILKKIENEDDVFYKPYKSS